MQAIEKMLVPTEQELMAVGHGLSFHASQAWTFSASYISSYLNDHAPQYSDDGEHDDEGSGNETDGNARTSGVAEMMAAGRLEWLLQETRPCLSGQLSEWDITTLLDCYQGQIFSPDDFWCVASDLCDHLGVQVGFYETSDIALLVDKLLGLNRMEIVTLADALEQTWHRGMKQENMSPKEFLATLGINLT